MDNTFGLRHGGKSNSEGTSVDTWMEFDHLPNGHIVYELSTVVSPIGQYSLQSRNMYHGGDFDHCVSRQCGDDDTQDCSGEVIDRQRRS